MFRHIGKARQGKAWHYGYVIIATLFMSQVLVFIGSRSLSIALVDIQVSLGVSVAQMGLIVSLYGGMANLGSVLWGGFGDRFGPRYASLAAGCVFSTGMVLCGLFGGLNYILAVILWAFTGFGSSGLQETIVPKLVNAWVAPNRRGHVMRLITPGGPVASMALGLAMPIGLVQYGWGGTFIALGIFSFMCTGFFLIIRNSPQEKGMKAIGGQDETVRGVLSDEQGLPQTGAGTEKNETRKEKSAGKGLYREALKLKITWHVGLIYILYQFYFISHTTYYVANVRSLGFSPQEAGLVVTLVGVMSVIAMQFWGPLSDRIGRRKALMTILISASLTPFIVFFVSKSNPSFAVLCLVLLCTQFAFSGAPVFMAILADYFPPHLNSTCNGIVSGLSALGSFLAPWIGGIIIDGFGAAMYYYCLPTAVGALLCFLVVARLPKPADASK